LARIRATLIPALAVPVSLIAIFAMFPLLGFSINTIALMGWVLAIGLVETTPSRWYQVNKMRLFTMTKTVAKNLLSGPATLVYPKKKRSFTPITRGRVEVDIDKCIFCGMCSRRCPTYAIKVAKNCIELQIDRLIRCTCKFCVEIYPKKYLSMENQYSPPQSEAYHAG